MRVDPDEMDERYPDALEDYDMPPRRHILSVLAAALGGFVVFVTATIAGLAIVLP